MTHKMPDFLLTLAVSLLVTTSVTVSRPTVAAEPFLGQIEFYGFNFAPRGWAFCDGQTLPINQNQSLFALLGTTFGGDGRTSFKLPDMRGRIPVHDGGSAGAGLTRRNLGSTGGAEKVTLSTSQIPAHSHTLSGNGGTGNQVLPEGNALADDAPDETYRDQAPNTTMHAASITNTGGNQAHENMPPILVVNCAIALQGLFPSRN